VTGRAGGGALDLVVAERWHQLITGIGPLSVARQVDSYERLEVTSSGPPPQAFVREMFVPAEPAARRTLDLFCAGLIERDVQDGGDRRGELVLLGPETIRAHTLPSASGLTVTDLRIGSAGPDVRTVSMVLMRITRTTRARDIVGSIEDLARLQDYQHDPVGSTAVAHAIVRRLEVLAAVHGTEIPVVGTITRLGDASGVESYHLLVNSEAPLSFGDDLRVRDGHLVIVGTDRRAVAWRGGDFILVQFGQPPVRRGETRSVTQLRQEHALVEAGLGRGQAPTAESYSSRTAIARQSSRAEQIVRYALAGDSAGAVTTFRAAVTEPGAEGPLVDSIAGQVTAVDDYWLVRGMLAGAAGHTRAADALGVVAQAALQRLDDRLDQLLGLLPDTSELSIPVLTPLVFEVSDALVPLVDSRQDGGLFLQELIPAMRDRILTGLGVSVPGVRARGNPALAPGGFTIQVDEVTVTTGNALFSGSYTVRPFDGEVPDARADLTVIHPLTGESGLWQITAVWDDTAAETAERTERLTPAQYLIHRIDMVFRSHLSRFLGLQEVANLVDQWTPADPELVTSALPDRSATIRLTWILQALADQRIPVTEWRAILGAIGDAGGIKAPVRTLARAARARLRGQLPGPRSGRRVVHVPAELQQTLTRRLEPSVRPPHQAAHEFRRWLQETVTDMGPALSVVARDEDTREEVAALARTHYGLVTTFTEEELASG
jgi:hypothetical protein